MNIIIYLGSLLVGCLVSLFWKSAHRMINILSKIYFWLVLLSVVSTWVFYFAGIKNATALRIISEELHWTGILAHLLMAYLLGRIVFSLKDIPADAGPLWMTLNTILWATSISYGNGFIIATVGKYMGMADMISFFKQSGYAIWFLYFIMAAETTGAIGVLSHFKWRMGMPAVIGLILIMLGAVYTHWHNRDPFSDSYAAVSQIISGSLLLILYFLERKFKQIALKAIYG